MDISNISNTSSSGNYSVVELNISDTTSSMISSNVTTECTTVISPMKEDIDFIDKTLTPIIYAFGFPGNILSFLIWIRPRMRHSSGVYLAALALVDFIFLSLHVLFELEKIWEVKTINMPVICEIFPVIFLTFQYLAPLLVLAFTIERYISICHPFKRERFCTTRNAELVSVVLAGMSLAICAIQGYFWTYQNGECDVRDAALMGQNYSLWTIWSWTTELLLFLVVPLSVLTFNVLVIKEAKRLSNYEHTQLHGRAQKTSATTIMLLAVSFYLIFTTLPVSVMYVSVVNFGIGPDCGVQDENSTWRKFYIYHLIRAVVEEIGITHFGLNFYIYLITGKMFRNEFKKMFFSFLNRTVPEKIRTEYTTMARTSLRGSLKKNMTVRINSNGTTGLSTANGVNGSETNL